MSGHVNAGSVGYSSSLPAASAQTSVRYFSQTGHYLRGAFRAFWERSGGVAIFGYPITEEYYRRSDGRIVQYFERARFELTVRGNQAIVELGLLGREVTHDRDFLRLHHRQEQHAGIAYCDPRTRSVGQIVEALMLIHDVYEPDEMVGRVEYL